MANDILPPSNPFARAIARAQAQRGVSATTEVMPPLKSPRARLNVFPDDAALASLIDRALSALSRGVVWARGAIVNVVV